MDGSKVELTINSPALRNPKKPRHDVLRVVGIQGMLDYPHGRVSLAGIV